MTGYVPGTSEKDHSKVIMALQNVAVLQATDAANITTNTTNIATNTSSIATNTTNIAANTASITAIKAAWTSYTPTITASAGTPTTTSASGRYLQVGKTVFAELDITVTTVGTASGYLQATLPVNSAAFRYVGSVFEYVSTGKSSCAFIAGGFTPGILQTKDATSSTWWVNGNALAITVVYESA